MSAISLPPLVDLEVPVRQRERFVAAPIAQTYPPIGVTHKRSSQTRAANLFASVLLNVIFMMFTACIVFVASGFVGNVELDAANREALQSMDRANAANVAESSLRRAVNSLESDTSVEGWASFNKFDSPYKLNVTINPAKVK